MTHFVFMQTDKTDRHPELTSFLFPPDIPFLNGIELIETQLFAAAVKSGLSFQLAIALSWPWKGSKH